MSSGSVNDACRELLQQRDGCPFYNSQKGSQMNLYMERMADEKVVDIEESIRLGRQLTTCPYFGARAIAEFANVRVRRLLHAAWPGCRKLFGGATDGCSCGAPLDCDRAVWDHSKWRDARGAWHRARGIADYL